MQPLVGLVIPIFQSKFIEQIVENIICTARRSDYIICIVNDGQLEVKSYLERCVWPENTLILNLPENRCFAAANNAGWKRLLDEYDSLRFLGSINDDTIPENGWLDVLVNALEHDEKCAMAGPVIKVSRDWFGAPKDSDFGVFKLGTSSNHWIHVEGRIDKDTYVPALSGFCFVARRKALEEVNYFDEEYCNSAEDLDICLKLLTHGWRLRLCKEAKVFHYINQSVGLPSASTNSRKSYKLAEIKWGKDFSQYNLLDEYGLLIRQEPNRQYKFAAYLLMFNCSQFILRAIDNCGPYVDKIYVAYSDVPWLYNPKAREKYKNHTTPEILKTSKYYFKIELIVGHWDNDEDQRNECAERARKDGFDYLIIHDSDEFYSFNDFKMNVVDIALNPDYDLYTTPMCSFWKTLDYVVINQDDFFVVGYPEFAINLRNRVKFIRSRTTNASTSMKLRGLCYHLSSVLSDSDMLSKISTWGHSHQFDVLKWYKNKWLKWYPDKKNIHPVRPPMWKKAVPFRGLLPEVLYDFKSPSFVLYKPTSSDKISDKIFDILETMKRYISLRTAKSLVKRVLRRMKAALRIEVL